MSEALKPFLTPDQVYQLNEKHGWFQYGDAQSDVSQAFAQDAIAMHEQIRAAAPDLLISLEWAIKFIEVYAREHMGPATPEINKCRAAVAKATGAA